MKWLILIVLLLILLVVFRYRKQIQTLLQFWKMFRQMRRVGKANQKPIEKREPLKDVPLVRCEKCGTWISPENALKFRSNSIYCSSKCMEKAAKLQSLVD